MAFIVHLQGFKRQKHKFVLKEFAVIELSNDDAVKPLKILIELLCEWNALPAKHKRVNSWLERKYHKLLWAKTQRSQGGDVNYLQVK